jgi:hypothetical protein
MTNPWLKKNPFMSMWLSGANSLAGSIRGHATVQAKRQAATAMTKAARDVFDLWVGAPPAPSAPKKRAQRRRQRP